MRSSARHEAAHANFDGSRCDVYYQGELSPDFYGWIFPHGETTSVGVGTAHKGFSLRKAVGALARDRGLDEARNHTPRGRAHSASSAAALGQWPRCRARRRCRRRGRAGLRRRDLLRHDRRPLGAEAVDEFCETGDVRTLRSARKRFMRTHGGVFWILGIMQRFWYANDGRRERFVSICRDRDVQQLTWDAYMNKELVRARPLAHMRIFFKNLAHLSGLATA